MIRYKHPQTGAEIVTSNDGIPKKSPRVRKGEAVTTADIVRGPDNKFHRKGEVDETTR